MIVAGKQIQNLQDRQTGMLATQGIVAVQVKRWSAGKMTFSSGEVDLFLLRPSTDSMRPTYITKGNLLY